jgi:DNA-binding XRE family transcriptional regulator
MIQLAREAGVPRGTLVQAAQDKPGRGSAALALRIARAARVSVEDILTGKLVPALVVCPHCGAVREGGAL